MNKPDSKANEIAAWGLLAVLGLVLATALLQVARGILCGVIYRPGGRGGRGADIPFEWLDFGSLLALIVYLFIALGCGGILVGLWVTRHDRY